MSSPTLTPGRIAAALPTGKALDDLRIGRGGEGDVYRVPRAPGYAVKQYRALPSEERQSKLRLMCTMPAESIRSQSAWPVETIDDGSGKTIGFVMPLIEGHKDIHQLYGPKSRRKEFPNADLRFLVHVAGNVARAFAAAHQDGIVIGDVNFGGITVSRDGTVKLLDCDSFQIQESGRTYFCTVAQPAFCPPELHGKPLHSALRTPNHDNFGLAVVIFHLLVAGRHPFAGRYSGVGEMMLERAIPELRYAYGEHAADKQMQPPPGVAPVVDIVGMEIAAAFELAFGPAGVSGGRPDARAWIAMLSRLAESLGRCDKNSRHWFPLGRNCPWCAMEAASGVALFGADEIVYVADQAEILPSDWKAIVEAVKPGLDEAPSFEHQPIKPVPRKGTLFERSLSWFKLLATSLIFLGCWSVSSYLIWPWVTFLLLWIIGLRLADRVFDRPSHRRMRKERKALFKRRETAVADAIETFKRTSEHFARTSCDLLHVIDTYQTLNRERTAKIRWMRKHPQELQVHLYLRRFSIEDAEILNIGPARKALLLEAGIETAAEVTDAALDGVVGFGPSLQQALFNWRAQQLHGFRYDPYFQGTVGIAAIDAEFRKRIAPLAQRLRGAGREMQRLRTDSDLKRAAMVDAIAAIDREIAAIDQALA
ncbi:DNA-binding helix-hairpin-helix protein with protein kinase domain [Bradyrhizobium sp. USDA 4341]